MSEDYVLMGNVKTKEGNHYHRAYSYTMTLCGEEITTRYFDAEKVECSACIQKFKGMEEVITKALPKPDNVYSIENILHRLERLESIEYSRGDLFLFIVDTAGNHSYLVASPSFESVKRMFPTQENIEYIGMASSRQRVEQIIRVLN